MNPSEPRLTGWRHAIAVLVAIVCLIAALPLVIAAPFVWFSDDILLSQFNPEELPGGADRAEYYAGQRNADPRELAASIQREAVTRMPLADYADRPLWRRMRIGAVIVLILSTLVIVSSIGVFRGREAARRRLAWSCIALALSFAWAAAEMQFRLPRFYTDCMRDWSIAYADLRDEIGLDESNIANDWGTPEPEQMKKAALVSFVVFSLPWQLAALMLACLFPRSVGSNTSDDAIGETPN